MCLKVEASSFEFFGYAQRKLWAIKNLSKPFFRFVGNGKLQTNIGGHHVVPYISQNDRGRTVELFEVSKAGFTPFWFELRPVRIQRGETPLEYFTRTWSHVAGCCGNLVFICCYASIVLLLLLVLLLDNKIWTSERRPPCLQSFLSMSTVEQRIY
jgi:hypothetical protein